MFSKGSGDSFVILHVYVDDIIIVGLSLDLINSFNWSLHQHFKLKDLSHLRYILGLEIACSKACIALSQRKYTLQLLEHTGFLDCKPDLVPLNTTAHPSAVYGDPFDDVFAYRCLVGRFLYLTLSPPNIRFVVHELSQFVSYLRTSHLQVAHHMLCYLKEDLVRDFFFSATSSLQLRSFSNADWATCPDSRYSITDFCVFLGVSLVSWWA